MMENVDLIHVTIPPQIIATNPVNITWKFVVLLHSKSVRKCTISPAVLFLYLLSAIAPPPLPPSFLTPKLLFLFVFHLFTYTKLDPFHLHKHFVIVNLSKRRIFIHPLCEVRALCHFAALLSCIY